MDEEAIRQTAQIELVRTIGSRRGWPQPKALTGESLVQSCLSYAQGGEDLVLQFLFKWRLLNNEPGCYVDIGCGDPVHISNTYLFYSHGWRGVCVDANPSLAQRWQKLRPDDAFVAAAVGTTEGETNFYKSKPNVGASRVADEKPEGNFLDGVKIPRLRLGRLLAEQLGQQQIDFLTLDVEGCELDVLQSNDWESWKPKAVLMECHGFDFEKPYAAPSVEYLRAQGYALTARIGADVLMALPA